MDVDLPGELQEFYRVDVDLPGEFQEVYQVDVDLYLQEGGAPNTTLIDHIPSNVYPCKDSKPCGMAAKTQSSLGYGEFCLIPERDFCQTPSAPPGDRPKNRSGRPRSVISNLNRLAPRI